MHAGEFAGVHAAIRLWREINPADLRGEIVIIPVMSTRAFFARSMQLSPVDAHEMHFQPVGHPEATYSTFHIDAVFNLLRDLDVHVDMHGGEYVQSLDPWIAFPEPQNDRQKQAAWRLAGSFPVPYLDPRTPDNQDAFSTLSQGLPFALLNADVVNVWTEIGQNGLQDPTAIEMQFQGLVNALVRFDMIDRQPLPVPQQSVVGPRKWSFEATHSGYWQPAIAAGQRVCQGQHLGSIEDLAGNHLESFTAPDDALVQYVWTSPAINVGRAPHGYPWHRGLMRLMEIRSDAHEDPRLQFAR